MDSAEEAQADLDASVIVVTHNNESLLARCLRSIERGAEGRRCEIVVVDNASADRTLQIAQCDPRASRVIGLTSNVGFAAANNIGIAQSRGRLIVLVNSDAFPDPDSIDALIAAMDQLPHAGIIGGSLRYPDGALQPSTGNFPSLLGGLWVALLLHRVPFLGRLDIGINAHPTHYRIRRRVDWVTAAYCVARRQAAPLPETAFMYGEDVEWGLACSRKGLEVWLEPAATAVHVGRASVDRSQTPGFAQQKRVDFELAWFGRRGAIAQIAARAILVIHALCRLLIYWPQAVRRGRDDGRVAEYVTLLSHAVGLGRSKR